MTESVTNRPTGTDATAGDTRARLAAAAAVAVLAVVYLLQWRTPLRLNQDAGSLIIMARSAAAGQGFTMHGGPAAFPVGYPAVLLLLDKAGVAGSPAYVGLNLACLGLFLWQFGRLARREMGVSAAGAWAAAAMTLLSFATVKHVTVPLADLPYAALSASALDAMTAGRRSPRRAVARGVAAVGLTAAAIVVRTIGVALVPALLWAAATTPAARRVGAAVRNRRPAAGAGVALAAVVALAGGLLVLSRNAYVRQVRGTETVASQLRHAAACRAADLGDFAVNVPTDSLPAAVRRVVPLAAVTRAAAAALVAAVLLGLWDQRPRWGPVQVYLLGFAAVLCGWPYADPRFYLPVAPFLFVLAFAGGRRAVVVLLPPAVRRPALAAAVAVACGAFAVTGAAALYVSTRLSWSGDRFADRYGTPQTRVAYQVAYGRRPASDLPGADENYMIVLLRQYEPRARLRR